MSIKGGVLPGGINQEIQGVTTQTRAHPDDFNPNVLKPLLDNDVTMSKQLETLPSEALTFRPGNQIVESEQDTPFRLGEVKGRTRINLLGNGANSLETWVSTRATHTKQDEFIKVTPKKEITHDIYIENAGQIVTTGGKYYVLVAEAYCENALTLLRAIAFNMNREVVADKRGSPIGGAARGSAFLAFKTPANTALLLCRVQVLNTQADIANVPGNATVHFRNYRTYEISQAEYDAIANMTPEQVSERYPYVDSMTNVKNPYAIVTGGNLLPPFYEWEDITIGFGRIDAPYSCSIEGAENIGRWYQYYVPALPNTTYTMSGEVSDQSKLYAFLCDSNKKELDWEHRTGTFTTPADTAYIRVLANTDTGIGLFTFKNPMLTVGTEPKPFTPQQRSMIAFETELAAHPVDGSNPDTVFIGDDGLPYVFEKWVKVDILGQLRNYNDIGTYLGYKTIRIDDDIFSLGGSAQPLSFMTKYDGTVVEYYGDANARPNIHNVYIGSLYISVPTTDSGWGPDYAPTPDEIKAYFLGWRMYKDGQSAATSLYDGNGVKWWAYRKDGVTGATDTDFTGATRDIAPTTMAPNWQPYRLQYLKAKPTVEPVRNYEIGATLTAGSNMVEVGSGIVLREKANPALYADNYVYLNNKAVDNAIGSNCSFRYKASTLLEIYKDRANEIRKWTILHKHDSAYGDILALISQSNFDPHAVYHVTYTILDPTLSVSINGTVAANLRGTISDLVQDVGDVQRRVSVVETQKAEKDVASPQWIAPILLNGWVNYYSYSPVGYYKNEEGIVRIRGLVKSGANGVPIFNLPIGYRPRYLSEHSTVTKNNAGILLGNLEIGPIGTVIPYSGGNEFVSLDGITFLAEQ
ncbi:hypothetical protein [Paenibacillus thiaminolyticus]|uniref:hypothetical protein n=1 Tax=Paenibacillus thiaminolyticus TaxID=49283 RepID=UPI0025432535|nr:hypothetical protein [Paenibacillus thiaminolyticus]WII36382.1 hypothetical protein O0V01_22345 [Paenibacillus thiaminolyticus]